MPNEPAIFMHLPNAVEGHPNHPSLRIDELKGLRVVWGELHFLKGRQDDPVIHAVKVAQREIPAPKLPVPADAV